MKNLIRKLSSRKLWAAIVGVIVGIAAAFGLETSEYAQIVGLVTSAASVITYIIGEAAVDAASAPYESGNAPGSTAADCPVTFIAYDEYDDEHNPVPGTEARK